MTHNKDAGPGEQLLMIIDRQPRPLYRILQNNGYAYRETLKPEDFDFTLTLWIAFDATLAGLGQSVPCAQGIR